jgi:HEAT repeat protein
MTSDFPTELDTLGMPGLSSFRRVCALLVMMVFQPELLAGQPALSDSHVNDLLGTLQTDSPEAVELTPRLIEIVADGSCSNVLRQRAAMTLGRIGTPAVEGVPVLVGLLDHPPVDGGESVRYWALKSLGLFGRNAQAAVPRLSRELSDRSRPMDDRILVADVLGQIGSGTAIEVLGRELLRPVGTDDASLLRQVIVDSFAYSGPEGVAALPSLVRVTSDNDADVRRKACEALGRLGPRAEPAIDSLVDRLVLDDSPAVRDAAAVAMSRLGPAAVPILGAMLRDGDTGMKWRAAQALGRTGRLGTRETATLQAATTDPDAQVRLAALDALWLIHRDPSLVCEPALRELSRGDRETRKLASQLLVSITPLPSDVERQLKELARSGTDDASRAADWILRRREPTEKQELPAN